MKKRKLMKRIISTVLSAGLIASLLATSSAMEVWAADPWEKTQDNTVLGTGVIAAPDVPSTEDKYWSGSYVYYGHYKSKSVKYRVLDPNTTRFSADGETKTMFLDCDNSLYTAEFDKDGNPNEGALYAREWAYSDIKKDLNDGKYSFYATAFTSVEQAAIASSTIASHPLTTEGGEVNTNAWAVEKYVNYVALGGEKIFLLDLEDLTNNAYGYSVTKGWDQVVNNRRKTGEGDGFWWTRSAQKEENYVGRISKTGEQTSNAPNNFLGVSPAFNIDLDSILFTSEVETDPSAYKLTLLDNKMTVAISDDNVVTKDGSTVTVPYTVSGDNSANASQVSVLILKDEYTPGAAIINDPESTGIPNYTYLKLDTGGEAFGVEGTGTFTLPDAYSNALWGQDYHVYILAEDVNGDKETDYASEPVEIMPTVTAVTMSYEGAYDGDFHGITVDPKFPADATVKFGLSADSCTWDASPEIRNVIESPITVYYELTAPGYNPCTGSETVTINKAPLTVTAKSKTITYGDEPANDGVTYSGFIDGEDENNLSVIDGTLDYDYSYSQFGNVGDSYTITPKGITAGNYDITFEDGNLTVVPKTVGLEWSDTELTYNGSEQVPTATATGLVNGDTCTVTVTGGKTDAGSGYTATASELSNANYALPDNKTTTFSIAKADAPAVSVPTVTEFTYDPEKKLSDIELDEGWSWTDGSVVPTVGNAGYDANVTVDDSNYDYTNVEGYVASTHKVTRTVTVPVAKAEVEAPEISSKVYSGEAQTAEVPASTLYDVTTNQGGTDVDTYNVVLTLTDTTNYKWSDSADADKTLEFSITKKPLTITADDVTKDYGDADPTLTYTSDGLVDGDEITGSLEREAGEDIGTYDITEGTLSAGGNYEVTFTGAKLTIICTHKNTEVRDKKEPTCTGKGYSGDKYCVDCGEKIESGKAVAASGHKYGEPEYVWSEDGKSCTATAVCTNDSSHKLTEKAKITSKVKTPATTINKGITTYTATFKNTLFKTQTNDIDDIPKINPGEGSGGDSGSTGEGYSSEWVDGKWYNADGTQTYEATLSWKKNSTGWWAEDTDGWYPKAQWQKIDGDWYYFNADGYMAADEWRDGCWLGSSGAWEYKSIGSWKSNSDGWWFEDESGWYAVSQWQKINSKWYYFGGNGIMATNQYVGAYWVGSDGACQ